MKKWFLRFSIALIAFILSVALTGAFRFLFGGSSSLGPMSVEPLIDFSSDQAQIREFYGEYGAAQTRHDRAFFERVEDENFILFVGDKRLTREEDIQWLERQPSDTVYEVRIENLKVYGNSAVSRGRMLVTFSTGYKTEWHFIDVWVKRYGVWRIQSTTSTD